MVPRLVAFLFVALAPSPQQNIAIVDEGLPFCGSILLSENLVLTAAHCVEDEPYVDIRCGSLDKPAAVVKADMDEDLAVLRLVIPCKEGATTTLALENPEVGTEVHAIGYPRHRPRLSRGVVSAYETSRLVDHATHPVLVSDTKIWFGNSGGGLFNTKGELVGIASQLDNAGYGYWIPVSSIHKFLDAL